jgi:hypothetical protein
MQRRSLKSTPISRNQLNGPARPQPDAEVSGAPTFASGTDTAHAENANLLRPVEAAQLLGVRTKTLANWRCQGVGPAFVKFGAPRGRGAVRYARADLLKWIATHTRPISDADDV